MLFSLPYDNAMTRFHAVFFLPVAAVLALAGCQGNTAPAVSSLPDAVQRRAIAALLADQTAAWNRGDLPGYMAGYWHSDSLVFVDGNGAAYGWQHNLAIYRTAYPSPTAMGTLAFSGLRVTLLAPAVAQVVGRWRLAHPTQGDERGHMLLVLRRLNGHWAVVADHSSRGH